MLDGFLLAAAANDSPATRWLVLAACVVFGAYFIYVGRINVLAQYAEESGKRRLLLKAMKKSVSHEGASAVRIGVMRIVLGIVLILFGIVFLFVGPFLAN
jgi:hypothetical protein